MGMKQLSFRHSKEAQLADSINEATKKQAEELSKLSEEELFSFAEFKESDTPFLVGEGSTQNSHFAG